MSSPTVAPEPIEIIDTGDVRLDDFRDLTRADRRPDRPGGRGLVIAEGVVVVSRMIASSYPIRAFLGVRRRYEQLSDELIGQRAPFYVASAELMAEVVGFHLNRGVLATADRVEFPPAADLLRSVRTAAVLEGIGDHENLGSIFRNAAALGVGTVLLAEGCADPLYRRAVRVSMGTVLRVPFGPIDGSPSAIADVLHRSGFLVVALTPRASSVTMAQAGLAGRKVALLLGSEGSGLSREALDSADVLVKIPMADGVDSLNVATAGAIAFAELTRSGDRPQRR